MQVTSPDTLEKRERYSRTGSKQGCICIFVEERRIGFYFCSQNNYMRIFLASWTRTFPKQFLLCRTYAQQKWKEKGRRTVKTCKLLPLILSRRESIIRGLEVNKRPYWFMCECKKDGCKKASRYAEYYSLSSLFLTT